MTLTINNATKALLNRRVHALANCWEIKRTDGVTFRLTDSPHALTLEDGLTYTPIGGFNTSAHEKTGDFKDGNAEFVGIISADVITYEDLVKGKYENARVTQYLVNWQTPWIGVIQQTRYWLFELSYDGETWTAQVSSMPAWLRTPVGRSFTRDCRHTLGDHKCKVDIPSNTAFFDNDEVLSVTTQRLKFAAATIPTGFNDDDFALGYVLWTSGLNAGVTSEIKSYTKTGRIVELFLETPFDIAVGDDFYIVVGCDGKRSTCRDKFANIANHGGFPTIPGTDKVVGDPNG